MDDAFAQRNKPGTEFGQTEIEASEEAYRDSTDPEILTEALVTALENQLIEWGYLPEAEPITDKAFDKLLDRWIRNYKLRRFQNCAGLEDQIKKSINGRILHVNKILNANGLTYNDLIN